MYNLSGRLQRPGNCGASQTGFSQPCQHCALHFQGAAELQVRLLMLMIGPEGSSQKRMFQWLRIAALRLFGLAEQCHTYHFLA